MLSKLKLPVILIFSFTRWYVGYKHLRS